MTAFDDKHRWELPEGLGGDEVLASPTCLAVPVRHAYDVQIPEDIGADDSIPQAQVEVVVIVGSAVASEPEFVCVLECASGDLNIGDAEIERVIQVPAGPVRIEVVRDRVDADHVMLSVRPPEAALELASEHGGSLGAWTNCGVTADDDWRGKQGRRPGSTGLSE